MAKEKKSKKAATTADNRRTRSKPVVSGASDPDIADEALVAGDVLPDVEAADGMATVMAGVGAASILLSAQEIQLDPNGCPGAPTIWMPTFQSNNPLSAAQLDCHCIAVLVSGQSGARPKDLRLSAKSTGNRVQVMWRRPDVPREVDHLLGTIAEEDNDLAKALNVFLRQMPGGWLVFDLDVPFQMEGFCQMHPGLQIATNAHQQER